jgi:hypothetical protein
MANEGKSNRVSRGKIKIVEIVTPADRSKVSFTFSRPLTQLEMQGLTTIVRQSLA